MQDAQRLHSDIAKRNGLTTKLPSATRTLILDVCLCPQWMTGVSSDWS